jgi:hypothetical protein
MAGLDWHINTKCQAMGIVTDGYSVTLDPAVIEPGTYTFELIATTFGYDTFRVVVTKCEFRTYTFT